MTKRGLTREKIAWNSFLRDIYFKHQNKFIGPKGPLHYADRRFIGLWEDRNYRFIATNRNLEIYLEQTKFYK